MICPHGCGLTLEVSIMGVSCTTVQQQAEQVMSPSPTFICGLTPDPDGFPAGPFCFTGVLLGFLPEESGI